MAVLSINFNVLKLHFEFYFISNYITKSLIGDYKPKLKSLPFDAHSYRPIY